MDTAKALVALYEEFYKMRLKHLGSKPWRSLKYFFKTMSLQKEYLDILEKEHQYQKDMSLWLSEYIEKNNISGQQISSANTTFHLFREELQGKNLFIIIFMVLLGLTGSFYGFIKSYLGPQTYTIVLCLNWLFGILAIRERMNVALHVTIANQLQVLLDKWLAENS